jgi:high-affinity Fe2+/Pb2+ permease
MSLLKKDKEKERYYLLAGMGGRAYRRKQNTFLAWSVVAGVLVSLVVAMFFYILNVRH